MKKAIYYDEATGGFVRDVTMQDDEDALPAAPGQGLIVSPDVNIDMQFHCVDTGLGAIVPRPAMPLVFIPANRQADADGAEEVIITGIPLGTMVVATLPDGANSVSEVVNDGQIEVSSSAEGSAFIHLVSNHYLSQFGVMVEFV